MLAKHTYKHIVLEITLGSAWPNLGYLDPASVKIEEWTGRQDEGVFFVLRAGEILFRSK